MRRGQAFVIDLLVAISILALAGVYVFATLTPQQPELTAQQDALTLAGAVFNPYPVEWNTTNVAIPGFVRDHSFNDTQFSQFDQNLTESQIQSMLAMRSQFFINITEDGITRNTTGTIPAVDADSVYSYTRLASFNGTVLKIEVIAWR